MDGHNVVGPRGYPVVRGFRPPLLAQEKVTSNEVYVTAFPRSFVNLQACLTASKAFYRLLMCTVHRTIK